MSGKVIKLLLSGFDIFFLPLILFGFVIFRLIGLALVFHKTEEINKTCYLEGILNLFGTIHKHNLWLFAYFLCGEDDNADTATS